MTKYRLVVFPTALLMLLVWQRSNVLAQTREMTTVTNASTVLDEVMRTPGKQIPIKLLAKAEAIVIIPNMIKGGFIIGARHGNGVALVRNASGGWDGPRLLQMTGGSIGFQAGVEYDILVSAVTDSTPDAQTKNRLITIITD